MSNLTPKQEKFCYAYLETSNASEAYRQAYNAENMKPESIWRMAHDVLGNLKVASMIDKLRTEVAERHAITIDDLIAELEEARGIALGHSNPQTSAAVAATLGKAKLLGLAPDKVEGNLNLSLKIPASRAVDIAQEVMDAAR